MRNYLIILFAVTLGLNSCNLSDSEEDPGDIKKDTIGTDILLSIGENMTFDYSDIESYDSSAHVLYFMYNHPEFEKLRQPSFVFYADGDSVYKGQLWPGYLSSLPSGPYIPSVPLNFQNYALGIEYFKNDQPDLRNDPRIIQNLKRRNLLHSGLSVALNPPEINGPLCRLSFTVTNMDKSVLLILDPDKMGHRLFHYFTNGLYLMNLSDSTIINSILESQTPVPWNGWSMDWLTQLNPGETRNYTVSYSFDSNVGSGNYLAFFDYPGLSYQVSSFDLFQAKGRIWLGHITSTRQVPVN